MSSESTVESRGTSLLSELRFRGLFHQCTHEETLGTHLAAGEPSLRRAYVGYDPTADSLTIGNLVTIMLLRHWQDAGHTPVVLMGGGTGLIGDPSGKTAERTLRTRAEVDANVRSQMRIFGRLLDFSESRPNRAILVNNIDWLAKLSYLDALRDIGKHFSVNMMIQKDSVRDRLNNRDQGISYTEFSYMILQAYDFLHLHRAMGVTMQMGGSDQWGNMVGGCDLIRRSAGTSGHSSAESTSQVDSRLGESGHHEAFALTCPLVTKADGGKFGKTESGAVWLTAERTSPYQFYQFWLNTADADVSRFLRIFTVMPHVEIERLEAQHTADPGKREAHRALARHITELLHGADEADKAEQATRALFGKSSGGGDGPFVLPPDLIASAPSSDHDRALLDGPGMALLDLLPQTTLAKSKSEARTLLAQNSISVNGHVAAADARVSAASLIDGGLIALRKGKKNWHLTKWA